MDKNKDKGAKNESISNRGETFRCERYCACIKVYKNISGAIEGEKYVVTWALGHLVTLADPEEYSKEYKEWKMEVLPMMPKPMKLIVIQKTAKQYRAVKEQLFRKDIGEIVIATDAGREGELVARWILEKAGCKKPIKRLWIFFCDR